MNPADTKSPKTDIDEEKAKILSKYFLSVFTTETNGNVPNLELNQSINPIFKFRNNWRKHSKNAEYTKNR